MSEMVLNRVEADRWLDRLGVQSETTHQDQAAAILVKLLAPIADRAELKVEYPKLEPGVVALLVPRTYLYVCVKGIKKWQLSILAAVIADAVSHAPPITSITTAASALALNLAKLTEPHAEMIRRMRRLSQNKLYRQWLPLEDIVGDYPTEEAVKSLETLAELKGMGVLEEAAGRWRAVL